MLVVAVLSAVAAGAGVFARGSGDTGTATSIRGERFEYHRDGVYAFNAERVVAEGVGWDALTLFGAAPALALAAFGVSRGGLRATLLAVGLSACFFYQYFMYALYWALGPLTPLHLAIFVLSATVEVLLVVQVDVSGLPSRFDSRFPRRTMVGYCLFMALLLTAMWSARFATALSGDVDGLLLGSTTLTVQVLDLGLIVPLSLVTAAAVWRRASVGYLLAPALAVKGIAMTAATCAMLLVAASVEGTLDVASFTVFALATVASVWLACRMFTSMRVD